MEDILINIDSRYRDHVLYPSETKFKINLNKNYKNISSIRIISVELNNSIINTMNYNKISYKKNNNYFKIHIPNKLNDPDGLTIYLDDYNCYTINNIINNINNKLDININKLDSLISNNEKYFYIFYLYNDINITFNLNSFLTINQGWYSIYGFTNIIINHLNQLNITQFNIETFNIPIYDRRYTNNIRIDTFNGSTYTNLESLKNDIYNLYISDTTNYIPSIEGTGILDNLIKNFNSKYYIFSHYNPIEWKYQIYNIQFSLNSITNMINITNMLDVYLYNLTDTKMITTDKDVPSFDIDFYNNTSYLNFGYYLGFRILKNNLSLYNSNWDTCKHIITSDYVINLYNDNYIYLKINNWGNFDLNNEKILAKIYFTNCHNVTKLDGYVSTEYKCRQPINIQKLDIELIDYLGNTVDLNGLNFSFTLAFNEIVSSCKKNEYENKNLVF